MEMRTSSSTSGFHCLSRRSRASLWMVTCCLGFLFLLDRGRSTFLESKLGVLSALAHPSQSPTPPTLPDQHRLLIVEYQDVAFPNGAHHIDNNTTSLQEYALANGHEYLFESTSYFPTDAEAPFIKSKDDEQTWLTDRLYHPSMNHIAVLLRVILHELSKEVDSRARWVWMPNDRVVLGDTLEIVDEQGFGRWRSDDVLWLGERKFGQVNFDLLLHRVSVETAAFLGAVLALEQEAYVETGTYVSAETVFSMTLKRNPSFERRFGGRPEVTASA